MKNIYIFAVISKEVNIFRKYDICFVLHRNAIVKLKTDISYFRECHAIKWVCRCWNSNQNLGEYFFFFFRFWQSPIQFIAFNFLHHFSSLRSRKSIAAASEYTSVPELIINRTIFYSPVSLRARYQRYTRTPFLDLTHKNVLVNNPINPHHGEQKP